MKSCFLNQSQHFISEATDEIQKTFRLQAAAMSAFAETVVYFGENPKTMTTNDVFGIFSDFIKNFEVIHVKNMYIFSFLYVGMSVTCMSPLLLCW